MPPTIIEQLVFEYNSWLHEILQVSFSHIISIIIDLNENKRIDAETRPYIETFRAPMFLNQKFEHLSLLLNTE